jgi:DNA-binding NtrC family response regulator
MRYDAVSALRFNATDTNRKQALELLEKHPEPVQVIVTDMRMPEMSGLELLKIVRVQHPRIVRIVLSGYTHVTTLLTAINQGEIYRYIMKPWETEQELLNTINDGLEQYDKNLFMQEALSKK